MWLFCAAYYCPAVEGARDAEGPGAVGVLAGYCCRDGVADEAGLACFGRVSSVSVVCRPSIVR